MYNEQKQNCNYKYGQEIWFARKLYLQKSLLLEFNYNQLVIGLEIWLKKNKINKKQTKKTLPFLACLKTHGPPFSKALT